MNINAKPDPVRLEIFKNLYQFIAEQMGIVLQNTAASVNIKERLDFSCAIFDASGSLVANAPHIPVHLGSMSASVTSLIANVKDKIKPGDVYLSNNPYNGGTHLPRRNRNYPRISQLPSVHRRGVGWERLQNPYFTSPHADIRQISAELLQVRCHPIVKISQKKVYYLIISY